MILRKKFDVYEEEVAHFEKEDVKRFGGMHRITVTGCNGLAGIGFC
jgi:hypothetical protein